MSLEPFFSLSPVSPLAQTYDAGNPSAPYAYAILATDGGVTSCYAPNKLTDQQMNNQILLAYDPVPEAEQSISDYNSDILRHCVVEVPFTGYNVSTLNQYLLVFRLARAFGSPIAQFFVGPNLVRDEALTQSPYDDIAILLDTPGDNVWVNMFVRLATPDGSNYHGFFVKGVDCYLL